MNWLDFIGPEWIQAGELGIAFVVLLLCAALVMYVMKTSARREQELLQVILKVLPVMEAMSASMTNITTSMGAINLRLESIEDNQILTYAHKAPNKLPRKKARRSL